MSESTRETAEETSAVVEEAEDHNNPLSSWERQHPFPLPGSKGI